MVAAQDASTTQTKWVSMLRHTCRNSKISAPRSTTCTHRLDAGERLTCWAHWCQTPVSFARLRRFVRVSPDGAGMPMKLSPRHFFYKRVMRETCTHLGQVGEEENKSSSVQTEKPQPVWRTASMDASRVLWTNWQEQLNVLLTGKHVPSEQQQREKHFGKRSSSC